MLSPKEIYDYIDNLYEGNAFVQLCGIKTHSISCGRAAVGLRLDPAKHTNLNASIHGGLLMAIMDNATGIAAAYITHRDGNMLTMSIHMYDKDHGKLMASGINSMLIIADFPGIPEQWEGSYSIL